jgi:hypothetical protein
MAQHDEQQLSGSNDHQQSGRQFFNYLELILAKIGFQILEPFSRPLDGPQGYQRN